MITGRTLKAKKKSSLLKSKVMGFRILGNDWFLLDIKPNPKLYINEFMITSYMVGL